MGRKDEHRESREDEAREKERRDDRYIINAVGDGRGMNVEHNKIMEEGNKATSKIMLYNVTDLCLLTGRYYKVL